MKALPDKTLEHYCALYPIAASDPDSSIDVSGINPSCIRAMYTRGLIEYQFMDTNGKTERRILFTKAGLSYGCEVLALATDANSKSRKREVLRVYLDMGNEDHRIAWDIARSLAGERILTPTLIDLLLMHSEFLNRDATTFSEAYPAMYRLMTEAKQDDLLARIEAALQNTPQSASLPPVRDLAQAQGLRPIAAAKAIEAPNFDNDEDMELAVSTSTVDKKTYAENFLRSLGALDKKE